MEEQNSEAKKSIPMRPMFSSGWQQRWRRRFQSHRGGDGEGVGRKKGDRDILATRSPPSPPLPSSRSSRITPDTRMEGEMAEERGGGGCLLVAGGLPFPNTVVQGRRSRILSSSSSQSNISSLSFSSTTRLLIPAPPSTTSRKRGEGRGGGREEGRTPRSGGKGRRDRGRKGRIRGEEGLASQRKWRSRGGGRGGLWWWWPPPLYIFQSQKPPLLPFPFSFSELPPSPTPASLIQLPSLREGEKGSSGGPKGEEAVGGPLSHLESFPPLHLLLLLFPPLEFIAPTVPAGAQ